MPYKGLLYGINILINFFLKRMLLIRPQYIQNKICGEPTVTNCHALHLLKRTKLQCTDVTVYNLTQHGVVPLTPSLPTWISDQQERCEYSHLPRAATNEKRRIGRQVLYITLTFPTPGQQDSKTGRGGGGWGGGLTVYSVQALCLHFVASRNTRCKIFLLRDSLLCCTRNIFLLIKSLLPLQTNPVQILDMYCTYCQLNYNFATQCMCTY